MNNGVLGEQKAVRGLSIAVIVLAALCLAVSVGVLIVVIIAMVNYVPTYGYGSHSLYSYYYDDLAPTGSAVSVFYGILIAFLVVFLAIKVFTLITGIITLRSANDADKLKVPFVLCIVAAACSLVTGSFISLALLIIAAIFIYRIRTQPHLQPIPSYGYPTERVTPPPEGYVSVGQTTPVPPAGPTRNGFEKGNYATYPEVFNGAQQGVYQTQPLSAQDIAREEAAAASLQEAAIYGASDQIQEDVVTPASDQQTVPRAIPDEGGFTSNASGSEESAKSATLQSSTITASNGAVVSASAALADSEDDENDSTQVV